MHRLRGRTDLPYTAGVALGMNRRTFHRAGELERRRDLVNATLDVIAEQGLRAATVRQIAARAGVTGGLIRHYFESKDQMVQEAYRELMREMQLSVEAAAEAGGLSARERLRNFIAGNLSDTVTNARTFAVWAAFIGHVNLDPAFGTIHREHYLAFLEKLESMLAAFQQEVGRVDEPPVLRAKAIAINGLIDGLWLEHSVARALFLEGEAAGIVLRSAETILGVPDGSLSQ